LVEGDGVIIKKGQPIFKVTPDELPEDISEADVIVRRAKLMSALFDTIT
jgi:hypothetical protein